jgi:hypothetical protein
LIPRALLAAAAAVLLTTGCGYVGDPLPPLANIPAPVGDLAAVERDARIIVQFTIPGTTTERRPIRKPLKVDLRVGAVGNRFDPGRWAAEAKPLGPVPVEKGRVRYEIPVADWAGREIAIGVRTIGDNGKASDWANFVFLPVVPPPVKPSDVRAEATAAGVRLTWTASGQRFRILRRSPGSEAYDIVATIAEHEWTDASTEYGKTYSYLVQTLVDLGQGRDAESALSDPAGVTPVDKFPPAPPAGLRGATSPGSIELTWDRNTEPDLAGYRVYRATGTGEFERVADVSLVPTYSDHNVERGKTYRYAVTAVDNAGNESSRSAVVEAALQ